MIALDLLKIAKYFLFASAFVPVLVWDKFLYPFVTLRASAFLFFVELALLAFLVWVFFYQKGSFTFKKSWLFLSFFAFFVISFVSAVFGESFFVSFFGTIERWWGVFTLLHYLVFFFLARALFEKDDWMTFFRLFVFVSFFVSLIGLLQKAGLGLFAFSGGRIIGTLGNAAYFSIYLLLNFALSLYLFFSERHKKYSFFYVAVAFLNFVAFLFTGTRGTFLGLIFGVFLVSFLYIFLGKSKKVKASFLFVSFLITISVLVAFLAKDTNFVKNTPFLSRISTISLEGGSISTRFISWQAALEGFFDNPFLGVGPENYNIVFNKYFKSDYYLYAASEPYFDRAHNNFLDILATSGIFGLLSYLFMVFLIFYILARLYSQKRIQEKELLFFVFVFSAYFVHLFFVFDDITSFLYFVSFLAFLDFLFSERKIFSEQENKSFDAFKKTAVFAGIVLVIFSSWQYNLKVAYASKIANDAFLEDQKGNLKEAVDLYLKSLSLNSKPQKDIVYSFVDFLYSKFPLYEKDIKISKDDDLAYQKGLLEAKKYIKKQIELNQKDALLFVKLANINSALYVVKKDISFAKKAEEALKTAISLSEDRPQYYHFLVDLYILSGQNQKALKTAEFALKMNEKYNASYFYVAKAYIAQKDYEKAKEYLDLSMEKEYLPSLGEVVFFASEMEKSGKYQYAADIYKKYLQRNKKDALPAVRLVILSLKMSNEKDAIMYAKMSADINPSLKKDVDYIISEIKKGNKENILKILTQ